MWFPLIKDIMIVNNSKVLLVIEYNNNGTFGSSSAINLSVNSNGCNNIDIDLESNLFYSIYNKKFKEVDYSEKKIKGSYIEYLIKETDYSIKRINSQEYLYKNNKNICMINDEYFNFDGMTIYIRK